MQKANVTVVVTVIVVVAAIFAAEWYWFDYRARQAEYEQEGIGPLPETSELSGDTAKIIECEDPEVGKFYTDADSCDEAEVPKPEAPQPPPP